MNSYPLVEMLAYFCRYGACEKPDWREEYMCKLKRVRSCHTKIEGGVRKSFYSVETKAGRILDLVYNEEELLWSLEKGDQPVVVDRVLALIKRHKHTHSRAHRLIPYWFELIPVSEVKSHAEQTAPALIDRVQPFRFQSGKVNSAQVIKVISRNLENVMVTKHLHYVVETDLKRFFHLVFIQDEHDWRFMQEVDEEYFFVR